MQSEAVAALIGALIGAGAPLIASAISERAAREVKRKQICNAIAAEISALSLIVRRRGYVQLIEFAEAACKSNQRYLFKVNITENYLFFVEASMPELGLLPSNLPSLVPRYVAFAKSCLEDLRAIHAGEWNHYTNEQLAHLYNQLGSLMQDALALGEQIVKIVQNKYPEIGL